VKWNEVWCVWSDNQDRLDWSSIVIQMIEIQLYILSQYVCMFEKDSSLCCLLLLSQDNRRRQEDIDYNDNQYIIK